jgi:hypothetical protein
MRAVRKAWREEIKAVREQMMQQLLVNQAKMGAWFTDGKGVQKEMTCDQTSIIVTIY